MPNRGPETTALGPEILHRHRNNHVILEAPITMSKAPKVRTVILTVGVTATAITGSWYGAGLKIKQDIKKVCIIFSASESLTLSVLVRNSLADQVSPRAGSQS